MRQPDGRKDDKRKGAQASRQEKDALRGAARGPIQAVDRIAGQAIRPCVVASVKRFCSLVGLAVGVAP